ncbi:GNAT family N-acetyltransferase [uncultured Erythrobacter sp.]|uniref:GNAT family N-acetyltransferase n=1 Tax=uncultured Erythrobacter sp. TaxID=263913 RepID=UPI00260FAB5A|nr:GNAT family N-acetyltransferase [uncultured Erythrobacter sp.]
MTNTLRQFKADDAPALASLTVDAIRTIGAQAYSPEQVEVWSMGHITAERFVARAEVGHQIYVIADESDAPVAYALLEPDGHLDMLYCSPTHAGRGLAGQLLMHAEGHARTLGVAMLYTEASELARPAFERAGYRIIRRRDFKLRGVMIHNYAMEKPLN